MIGVEPLIALGRPRPAPAGRALLGLALCAIGVCAMPPERDEEPAPAVEVSPGIPTIIDYGPCLSLRAEGPAPAPPRCTFAPERPFRLCVEPEQLEELEVLVDGEPVAAHALPPVDDGCRAVGVRLGEAATTLEVGLGEAHERWVLPVRAQTCAECHQGGGDAARDAAASLIERSFDPASRIDWTRELPPVLERLEAEGLVEEQLRAIDAVEHRLSREHRFDEAAAVLTLAEPLVDADRPRRIPEDAVREIGHAQEANVGPTGVIHRISRRQDQSAVIDQPAVLDHEHFPPRPAGKFFLPVTGHVEKTRADDRADGRDHAAGELSAADN